MNVYELVAKLSLDSKEYEEGLSTSKAQAEGFGSKFGTAMKTIGTIGVAAIGAAATATAELTKQSIEAYASYEQLAGGVETLFSNLDGTVSSASTVMENAANAYKTAGMSANEYMETVTSFSAALVSSLNGDYDEAARISDMAVTDMADNANKMGTSMDSIQNAYQGFAKQNYTMLDNLKLGYGGTKEEMERLLADAQALSGVEYNIENLNDVYEAIHVIQSDIGITGTTALEAGTTIEGSINTVKGAWTNLLTGMADDNADIDGLIDNLVTSLVGDGSDTFLGAINVLVPRVEQALMGIGTVVEKLAPIISEKLPPMIDSLLPSLVTSVNSLITGVLNALPSLMQTISTELPKIVSTSVKTITSILPQLLEAGIEMIYTLSMGMAETVPELTPIIVDCVLLMVETLLDNQDMLIEAVYTLTGVVGVALARSIPTIVSHIPALITSIVRSLYESLPALMLGINNVGSMVMTQIFNLNTDITNKMGDLLTSLKNDLPSKAKEVGVNLVKGLWNGVNSMIDWVKSKISGFSTSIVKTMKSSLGIHSPSTVFAEIGGFMAEGLGVGWDDEAGDVKDGIIDDMTFDDVNVATRIGTTTAIDTSTTQLIALLSDIRANMGQSIVLDTGTLVGATVGAYDNALGNMATYNLRGVTA